MSKYTERLEKKEDYMELMLENYNQLLEPIGLKALIWKTDDYFGNGDESIDENDPDYGKAMFEACLVDQYGDTIDDTTTGRYCYLHSVNEEILPHIEKQLKMNV